MNPMPQLTPHLKQLRLSGILDSLEIRNLQAVEQKLTYIDFLALPIEDEIARREAAPPGINAQKTREIYNSTFSLGMKQTQIMDLVNCRYLEETLPVLIVAAKTPCSPPTTSCWQQPSSLDRIMHGAYKAVLDVSYRTPRKDPSPCKGDS